MWCNMRLAFVMAAIGGMIFSIIEVDAQSTVDDSASCESSTSLEDAVNLIREDLKDVKNQQRNNLEDLKAACMSNQQQIPQTELPTSKQALASAYLCEYTTRITTSDYTHFVQCETS